MIEGLLSVTLIVSTSLFVALSSCDRVPLADVPVTKDVTFDKYIRPITSTVCIECHSQGSRDFSQYNNAFSYKYAIYQRVVVDKSMPRNKYLSEQDRALFRDWVNQGAKK